MSNTNWRTVQLPASLVDKVEKKLKQKNSTHTGISDYITDKVRLTTCIKCDTQPNVIAHYEGVEPDTPLCFVHWEQKDEDGELFWQIGAKPEWVK